MPSLRRPLLLLAAALAAFFAPAARAQADSPVPMLRQAVAQVIDLAYDGQPHTQPLSARLRPILASHFDFDMATRFAVGIGWRQFTPEQRKRTTALFSDLVIRTYADHFKAAGPKPVITYGAPVVLTPDRREVPSTLTAADGKQYSVAYRVERSGDRWLVYDVIIEGVSMVANYRAQFVPLFQNGGAEAIIQALQKNLDTVSSTAQ